MNAVTDFLSALREDLRDRRMLPLVILVSVAMLAAIAFVILGGSGGGSSAVAPTAGNSASANAGETTALVLTPVSTSSAVDETATGASAQHTAGATHNPFALLPSAIAAEAKASGGSSTSSTSVGSSGGESSSSSSSGSSSSGSSGSESSGGESSGGSSKSGGSSGGSGKHSGGTKAKPKSVYQVSVLFGEAVPGTPSEAGTGLKPYENLKLLTPLPSKEEPLVVFRGVNRGGTIATFTVASETILQGQGRCLPSAFECKAIQLKANQNETLQYLKPGTQTVQTYELRLVSITPATASSASLASVYGHESKAGLEVLRRANLVAIPGLGMSSLAGVLVHTS